MKILASIKINSSGATVTQAWETKGYKDKNYIVFSKTTKDYYILVPYDSRNISKLDIDPDENSYLGGLSLENAIVEQIKD